MNQNVIKFRCKCNKCGFSDENNLFTVSYHLESNEDFFIPFGIASNYIIKKCEKCDKDTGHTLIQEEYYDLYMILNQLGWDMEISPNGNTIPIKRKDREPMVRIEWIARSFNPEYWRIENADSYRYIKQLNISLIYETVYDKVIKHHKDDEIEELYKQYVKDRVSEVVQKLKSYKER